MAIARMIVFAVLVLLTPWPAGAQPATDPGRVRAMSRLASACPEDVERFCPYLEAEAGGREQLICLRPYRSSLSLGCRTAVNAALQP